MESFRDALERLTQTFVTELLETVRAAALEQAAQQEKRETRPKPTRILRTNHVAPAAVESAPVVVRKFEIPVGQPTRRRRRAAGAPQARPQTPGGPGVPGGSKNSVHPVAGLAPRVCLRGTAFFGGLASPASSVGFAPALASLAAFVASDRLRFRASNKSMICAVGCSG